jgi:hypothetical protein
MSDKVAKPKMDWPTKVAVLAGVASVLMGVGWLPLAIAVDRYPGPRLKGDVAMTADPDWHHLYVQNKVWNKKMFKRADVFLQSYAGIMGVAGLAALICGRLGRGRTPIAVSLHRLTTVAGIGALCFVFFFAGPFSSRPVRTRSLNTCINNLRQLAGAKEQWALENKKLATDTPTWLDLIGTDKYIKVVPECLQDGWYRLNQVSAKPTCSRAGHTLP